MKLEWPTLTSTWPLLLFLPIVIRRWRTIYSNSRPSSLAMGVPLEKGLAGADLRARSAHASLSCVREYVDIVVEREKKFFYTPRLWPALTTHRTKANDDERVYSPDHCTLPLPATRTNIFYPPCLPTI